VISNPLRDLARHPVRSGLALAGIAITTAMLLDMVLLAGGIERSFERMLLGRGYQIRVSPKGTLPFDTEATIPGAGTVIRAIQSDTAVVAAGPLLGSSIYARQGDSLVTLFGYGVDPTAQALYQLEEGKDLTTGDSLGLLISRPVATLLRLSIGDSIRLVGRLDPQMASAAVERRLVVRGKVRWLYDYRGQPSVGANLAVMQDLSRLRIEDRVSAIVVRARSDAEAESVSQRLRARLPMLEINSVADLVAHFRQRLVYFRQLSYILGTISLIATLRAIGVARGTIVKGVMLEGAALTFIGGVLGSALGTLTAQYLDRILTSFPGLPAAISFFVPNTGSLAVAATVLVITGIVAGAYPALLAARAPIAATLRTEAT
jgi:putative ABC transport system permease protein